MKRIIKTNGQTYIRLQTAIWAGAIVTALSYGIASGRISTPRLDSQQVVRDVTSYVQQTAADIKRWNDGVIEDRKIRLEMYDKIKSN